MRVEKCTSGGANVCHSLAYAELILCQNGIRVNQKQLKKYDSMHLQNNGIRHLHWEPFGNARIHNSAISGEKPLRCLITTSCAFKLEWIVL